MPPVTAAVARSRVTDVCSQLSHEIRRDFPVGGGWLPPERELAKKLGVSRTVIREATKRLELQGLIEVQHGVGLKVVDRLHAPLIGALELLLPEKIERLAQLAETRKVVEPELARQAAERATAKHLQQFHAAQEKLSAAVETGDAIDADLEFHRTIARAAGNQILELLLESLGDLGRESRRATIATTGKNLAYEHHAQILESIERRDGQQAFDLMRKHVDKAGRDLKKHFNGKAS